MTTRDATGTYALYKQFSSGQKYLSAWPDRSVRFMNRASTWEKFYLMDDIRPSRMACIKSFHGTYLSAWSDGNIKLTNQCKEWELWGAMCGSNVCYFQSYWYTRDRKPLYLCANTVKTFLCSTKSAWRY